MKVNNNVYPFKIFSVITRNGISFPSPFAYDRIYFIFSQIQKGWLV